MNTGSPTVTGMQHLTRRVWSMSPRGVDTLVVAVVAVPTLMDAWWNEAGTRAADAVTYALTAISILALLARRSQPVAVAIVAGAAWTGLTLLGHRGELLNLPFMVALYTVAARGGRQATIVAAVAASCWSGLLGFVSESPIGAPGGTPVLEILWPLVPLALGDAVRSRRDLAARAAAERDQEARRRVEEERARISREFHDVVAHTMTAVNVQMAAAVAAFDTNPNTARAALHQARASSKAALEELRATIAVTRHDTTVAPTPSLERLTELASPVRAAGIEIRVDDRHRPDEVSGATSLAAYRIVQEALTNVVRHSNAGRVVVSLHPAPEGLVVEVTDDGPDPSPQPVQGREALPAEGFGLMGMTERARAVGGNVEYGRVPGGGFRVRAVLPTTRAEP